MAQTLRQIGVAPRLLTREQAAAYCGVGVTTFTAWVRRGIVLGRIPGTHRWDRNAIDATFDVMSQIHGKLEPDALDRWKATRLCTSFLRESIA